MHNVNLDFYKGKMIYLASPYSHDESWVRVIREKIITAIGARMSKHGMYVYGPITESHQYQVMEDLPACWQYWGKKDELNLKQCDELWVIMMKGWRESKGVQGEIEIANQNKIPVVFMHPADILPHYEEFIK